MRPTKTKQYKVIQVWVLTQQFNDDVNGDYDHYDCDYDICKQERPFKLVENVLIITTTIIIIIIK